MQPLSQIEASICMITFIQDYTSGSYNEMYYKNGKSMAIRRKFAKKNQIMSFGGVRWGKSEGDLRKIAKRALAMLDDGRSEKTVKAWAKKEVLK